MPSPPIATALCERIESMNPQPGTEAANGARPAPDGFRGTALLPTLWPADPLPQAPAPAAPPALLLLDRRDPSLRRWFDVLSCFLSPPEQERMGRYRRPGDRERFLIGRGVLRLLLAPYTGLSPQQVRIGLGPHGKPFLRRDSSGPPARTAGPHFNVSHSGDLVLVALHPSRTVGVDVEQIRRNIDWLPIARRCLAEDQLMQIQARPAADRPQEFVRRWCHLEARLKLSGMGLRGAQPCRRSTDLGATGSTWDVALPADYCGAVAMA